MIGSFPTPDPGLNALLRDLVTSVQAILGENFVAAYLQGSFALGDWDADSDVDFLIALDHDVLDADVPALQAMHARLHHLDSPWAAHLEGSYFPAAILRRADPARTPTLFLDNGSETLITSDHDNTMIVRWSCANTASPWRDPRPTF